MSSCADVTRLRGKLCLLVLFEDGTDGPVHQRCTVDDKGLSLTQLIGQLFKGVIAGLRILAAGEQIGAVEGTDPGRSE